MKPMTRKQVAARIERLLGNPLRLRDWLDHFLPGFIGPSVASFDPPSGRPGCLVTIQGANFSPDRLSNAVEVGGQAAFVAAATTTELKVVTSPLVADGPVKVKVGTHTGVGPHDFAVLGYPDAGAGEDGPPIGFSGDGNAAAGDVNPIGTLRVLVVLLQANDRSPPNAATTRTDVSTTWASVTEYYKQASYDKTKVQVDVTTAFATLDGTFADFVEAPGGEENIRNAQLDRLTAQAAKAAQDDGKDLNNYVMMACVLYTGGTFIRAWGGWSKQNFAYNNGKPVGDPARIDINITLTNAINLIAIQHSADWGRCAHEFGHNIVSAPSFSGDGSATLGEDVYSSDLVDGSAATAADFEIMGHHDSHPLFSGYHLDKLGYYDPANVHELTWDRNPFTQDFEVIAHGLAQDVTANRFHLLKIKVTDGLHYYVQVRQRPGTTAQRFDDSIPVAAAANAGGVIVTAVIADTLNTNQQTRFITLMHPNQVLLANDFVDDPARALRITVINDSVQARPLVCSVRVEWAQTIADDPSGAFDLTVTPWDSNWQSPDIWVDRAPFGSFDNPNDAQGRPQGNGDKPKVLEINKFIARINVSGAMGASNVKVTFYSVFPPGVGDNGNWAPISSQNVSAIAQDNHVDVECNWVPVVGQHTCLKVYASEQFGEVSGGNNGAQENVFDFIAASHSPGTPVFIRTAIRNPLDEKRMVHINVDRVPKGWGVHFPHAWVWLDAKAEKHFDLLVVPLFDYGAYQERKLSRTSPVRITGRLPRSYSDPLPQPAGSRFYPIGGTLNNVHIRRKVDIDMKEEREQSREKLIVLVGGLSPAVSKQRVRVDLFDPKGALRVVERDTDAMGRFTASFDLGFAPSLEANRKKWKRAKTLLKGTYRARAVVWDATEAVSDETPWVFITR